MTPTVAIDLLSIVPWLFGVAGFIVLAVLAWKIGLPAFRIAELSQRVKLVETKLETAKEKAEAAEVREQRCIAELQVATSESKKQAQRVAALLTVFELKTGAKELLKGIDGE